MTRKLDAAASLPKLLALLAGDKQADRVVPPTGHTAFLTQFTAAVMALLAVFALAMSMASGRLAERWGDALARSSTLRISAPADELSRQTEAALRVLQTTPGVTEARALTADEQRALLEPWFGPDLPVEVLSVPALIEIVENEEGYDAAGLRARLAAEAPGAVLDDHTRWRAPLVEAAGRLRLLAVGSVLLIAGTVAAMVTLAAQAALAANGQVIEVLRLIGARDVYIARAFVRRFTLRAFFGAVIGTLIGMLAVWLLPAADVAGGFLTGLGFSGLGWLVPMGVPLMIAIVAFVSTRSAALRSLRRQS